MGNKWSMVGVWIALILIIAGLFSVDKHIRRVSRDTSLMFREAWKAINQCQQSTRLTDD